MLELQHQNKLTEIDRKAVINRTQAQRQAINQLAQLWSQNIAKLLTLQQGFAATLKSIYSGMVDMLSTALSSIIEKWIEQELTALVTKRAAQSADGAATVTSHAGQAGAAAYAATAAIPIVGPAMAPLAASAAMTGAMSFMPMTLAEGGWYDVPHDGALSQLHKNEMVLPAWAARPLRSILTGGRRQFQRADRRKRPRRRLSLSRP